MEVGFEATDEAGWEGDEEAVTQLNKQEVNSFLTREKPK